MQLGYSRKKFAEEFHFSSATLQAWEDGKYTVPLKGILKYVHALAEAGLVSSADWFLHGVGISPRPKTQFAEQSTENNQPDSGKQFINEEINCFEQPNQDSIIVSITDDTMLPFFKPGDFVGGHFLSKERIEQHIGSFCIVIIATGEILVRKLKYGSKEGYFTLVSTNLDSDINTAFLTNCDLQKIAPISWHRKAYNASNINQ